MAFCSLMNAQTKQDTLIVAYTQAPPFIIDTDHSLEGINIWLWEKTAKELGLNYQLQKMEFTAMLEALSDSSVHLSINPLTITSERSKTMDFTHSFFASNSTVVVRNTSYLERVKQFLQAFFNLNFLSGFFVLVINIFLFGLVAWYFERSVNPEQFRPGWRGIWDGLWWSVVTMTTVGYGDKSPKSRGGKMIALVWMFSGLLFISGLTASVASSLTINQLKSNPEGFNEFKERPVGCITNSSTNEFLRTHFFNDIQLYTSLTEGLDDLSRNKIDAFLYDEPILKYRIQQNEGYSSNLRLLPTKFDLQFYAFGLAKGQDELRETISQKILEITESLEWRIILNEYKLSEI